MAIELFPSMTMWWPYWKGRDNAGVTSVANDMVYMQQSGVVLMGMEWGAKYALPADVEAKLDIFIAKGIKPYLGLWVGKLTELEREVSLRGWNAGNGKWAGIVLDAENQWVNHCKTVEKGGVGAVQAKADFDGFMAIFRPLTSQLAVACYASPTSFPNYNYDWWNEAVDTFLPLAYFNSSGDTAAAVLTAMKNKFNQADNSWTSAAKRIVPVMNGYSSTMTAEQVTQRSEYIDIAITDSGSVHIWRWIGTFPENMREMLHNKTVASPPPPPITLTLAASTASGATNLKYTGSTTGLLVNDWILVGNGTDVTQITVIGTSGTGGTGITFSPALLVPHGTGAPVTETSAPSTPGNNDLVSIVDRQRGTVLASTSILHPKTLDPLYTLSANTLFRVYGTTYDGARKGVVAKTSDGDGGEPKAGLAPLASVTNLYVDSIAYTSGNLATDLDTFNTEVSGQDSEAYVIPSSTERSELALAWNDVVTGQLHAAANRVAGYGYEVLVYTDTNTSASGRVYHMLREVRAGSAPRYPKGWGWYIYVPGSSATSAMTVQCPHTQRDYRATEMSVDLFYRKNAALFLLSGANAKANAALDANGNNVSDVANYISGSVFQSIHDRVIVQFPATHMIQVHGFLDADDAAGMETVISRGARDWEPWHADIARRYGATHRTRLYGPGTSTTLSASPNVQGQSARTAGVKWMHREFNRTVREGTTWQTLNQTLSDNTPYVSGAPSATAATDEFNRTTTGWLGLTAEGLPWETAGFTQSTADGSRAVLSLSANSTRMQVLPLILLDGPAVAKISTDKLAVGGDISALLVTRAQSSNTFYRGRVYFKTTGAINLSLESMVAGTVTTLVASAAVSGLTHSAGTEYWLKVESTGTSPTTLRAKVWLVGDTEPGSWTQTTTDSTSELQAAGGVGIRGFLSSAATNGPVEVRFDSLDVN